MLEAWSALNKQIDVQSSKTRAMSEKWGASLVAYGSLRGMSEESISTLVTLLYNVQAFVACFNMPHLGHNGVLKPEQLADITAYLLSPESTVNSKQIAGY